MKIGFDARMITHPGIGRYIRNLVRGLAETKGQAEFTLYGDPGQLTEFGMCSIQEYHARIYSMQELFFSPFSGNQFDIIHVPNFNAPYKKHKPLIVTIHDLIYLKFPRSSNIIRRKVIRPLLAHMLRSADRIIAVSEHTKKDILDYFPFSEGKISVIYEAADPVFREINDEKALDAVKRKFSLPREYLLFVGSLRSHKNIERLLQAFMQLRREGVSHGLVVVGRVNPREKYLLNKINSTGCLYLNEVSGEELVSLFNLATALLFPSLYEGFGLPVLEAMACGLPVAASSFSSLPEIAGDAAVFFNPLDVDDMAAQMRRIINEEGLRQELRDKGFRRARMFSWERAARHTMELYQGI